MFVVVVDVPLLSSFAGVVAAVAPVDAVGRLVVAGIHVVGSVETLVLRGGALSVSTDSPTSAMKFKNSLSAFICSGLSFPLQSLVRCP